MDYKSPTELFTDVGKELRNSILDDRRSLLDSSKRIQTLQFRLAEAVVDWHQLLAEQKNRMLHPKDKDMTELDRNTMLDAHVAVIRRDYEFLAKLEELVKERLDIIKVLLTKL